MERDATRKGIRAVVFHLYGTLVDNFSLSGHEPLLREMAAIVDAPADDAERGWFDSYDARAIGDITGPEANIELIWGRPGIAVDEARVREAAQVRCESTRKGLKPWPGVIQVLSRLKALGYKIALISDCSADTPASWRYTPLSVLLDATMYSCVVGLKKPDPRIFHRAAAQLGVRPEECLYVGDGSSHELGGAGVVGMQPVMIRAPAQAGDAHGIHEDEWKGPRIALLTEVLDKLAENPR